MSRTIVIALAFALAVGLASIGSHLATTSSMARSVEANAGPMSTWSAYQPADRLAASAATSSMARSVEANAGPISTWSAYQPAERLAATYAEIDHTSVYNAYEQVYGN